MTGAFPETAPTRSFPPETASVPLARRFIRDALTGVDLELVDMAELLTSELVTNALLHAHTTIDIRTWTQAGRVHVRVSDREEVRPLVPREQDPEASTGRGLRMVELVASTFGVDPLPQGKTVWFELWPGFTASGAQATGWAASDAEGTDEPRQKIVLRGTPLALYRAAQRHRDSLLRECKLQMVSQGEFLGFSPEELFAAEGVHDVITAAATRQLATLPSGDATADLVIEMPESGAPAIDQLGRVLEAANQQARAGRFLTRPALPELLAFRRWLLSELSAQLAGAPATPWAPAGDFGDPTAGTADYQPWRAETLLQSEIPMIAADDNNVITAANEAAGRLLGWPSAELAGQRILAIIPPELRQRHVVGFTNFLLTGDSQIIGTPVLVSALHRDGHTVDVSLLLQVQQAPQGRTVFVAEFTPVGATAPEAER